MTYTNQASNHLMTHAELQQVQTDLQNGIVVCRSTIEKVVQHALNVHPYASPMLGFFNGDPESTDKVLDDLQKAKASEIFPIHEGTLRHLFERQYGPKNDFAWLKDGKYKNPQLQQAWELWNHAATSLMMHLTGVWQHDEDCAKRLRAICKLVGINDSVPQKDDDLWASSFAVLGLVRKAVKERLGIK
jgi:hypothetical protein